MKKYYNRLQLKYKIQLSKFIESRKIGKTGNNTIYIRKLNSTVLQLLVDYIYTGEIIVTKKNVQV